jgi:hypothetical protein
LYQEKRLMTDGGGEEFDPRDFRMRLRLIAAGVLLSPRAFFLAMRPTGGMMAPFSFMPASRPGTTLGGGA